MGKKHRISGGRKTMVGPNPKGYKVKKKLQSPEAGYIEQIGRSKAIAKGLKEGATEAVQAAIEGAVGGGLKMKKTFRKRRRTHRIIGSDISPQEKENRSNKSYRIKK